MNKEQKKIEKYKTKQLLPCKRKTGVRSNYALCREIIYSMERMALRFEGYIENKGITKPSIELDIAILRANAEMLKTLL